MQHQADEKGKVFVGGLSWDTNNYSMLKYFSRYGEVIDCVVMKNPDTGKSRGFGFVTFKDANCVDVVLSTKHHLLDGRQIDPKACNPRSMNKGSKSLENSKRKIFIGGLPVNVSEQELVDLFKQYGPVEEVVIMLDQHKQRSRGFGFLTFECEESVDKVVKEHFILVNGKQVEVKRAEPRDLKLLNESSTPTTPSTPYHMGSILLAPSSHTPLPLFHVQPPLLQSPIGVISQEPIFTPPSWNTPPHNGLQLANSNPPILFIEGGSVGMTPSPSTPLTYQFWNPPTLPDPRITFLPTPLDASLCLGTVSFVPDACPIIANVLQDGSLSTATNNGNSSNIVDSKSNIEIHNNNNINISNYIEANVAGNNESNNNNNNVDYNNNNMLPSNTHFLSNHHSNNNFIGVAHSSLYTIHPSLRNHSTTGPAFHPYRR